MRFFDCFTFSRELDLLELRFEELSPVVDRFVLVESTRDYQLRPKRLFFLDNLKRYERWLSKVTHVAVDELGPVERGRAARYGEAATEHDDQVWSQHRYQRNQILVGLKFAGAEDDDICLIADADEIPTRETVRLLRGRYGACGRPLLAPLLVPTRTHFFFMDLVCDTSVAQRLVVSSVGTARTTGPDEMRELTGVVAMQQVPGAINGWHYSYFGTPAENVAKLAGMCETSFLRPALLDEERMRERMVNLTDPLDRPFPMRKIPFGDDYPETVKADPRRWAKFFSSWYREGGPSGVERSATAIPVAPGSDR